MRFALLGPLEVTSDDGSPVDVGGRQPRVLLAALAAANGRPVPPGALIEAIWGAEPPASATGTLQSYISRLRRALEAGGGPELRHDDAGYRLDVDGADVDVARFEAQAAEGRELLDAGRLGEARQRLGAALDLWRGPALVDLVDQGIALAEAASLEERRLAVLEDRLEADLALGRHHHLVGELRTLVDEHPLREGLRAKLALALYRAGRQADALRALADAGRTLREELGIEPSRPLRDLEAAILAHDPGLDLRSTAQAAARGEAPAASTLAGRDAELADLAAAYEESKRDARFAVLEGDPGIGKTRLADELGAIAGARGSLVVWGRSDEGGAAPSLWTWLPVLRAVASSLADVPAPLAQLLAAEVPLVAGQGGAAQFERFDAIATALERAGAAAPTVVLLDDLQWADGTSLDLLRFLATRLHAGVLVVATVRSLEVGRADAVTDALGAIVRRSGSRRLRLRGLSPAATGTLLDAHAGGPLPEGVAARIRERAEGNPFYAIELARLIAEDPSSADEVPATVRDAVRRRLAQLPAPTLELLEAAATIGRDVAVALVARVAGADLGTCLQGLDPAVEHRVLEASPAAPGALRFAHPLVREVVLDGVTATRRAGLHLRVADALGEGGIDPDHVELVADHLWRALPLADADRTAAALEHAAETAVCRVAYAAAEELLGRAATLRRAASGRADAEQAELTTLLRLLEVMQATRYFSGTDRQALHRAQALAAELGLDDVSRKLDWYEWAALSTGGRLMEAQPMAERFLERWCNDPRAQVCAAAHALMGVDHSSRGRFPAAVDQLDRAAELLDGAPPPADIFELEHRVVAHAFGLFSHAAHGDVTPEDALAGFDGLLALLPPAAVPTVCAFAGMVAATHARWESLARLVRHALEVDPAAQFGFSGGQLLMYRALVLADDGALEEALASFEQGRARFRAVGGRVGTASWQALLAELLARAGRVPEAAELVSGARLLDAETGEGWNEVTICVAEGVVAYHAGEKERAAERLAAAVATGRAQGALGFAARAERVAADLAIDLPA